MRTPFSVTVLRPLLGIALAVTLLAGGSGPAPAADLPAAAGAPAELLRWQGDVSSATGAALGGGECDVNGDDLADTVVGAWFWDKAPANNIGAAYVLLGGEEINGASLADPAAAGAVRIDGPATANAFTSFAVACLGDVNGDGLDDIGLSHYTAQKMYVVLGARDFEALDLGSLGDRGYVVAGGPASGNVGFALAPVGDINADGLADFGVAEVVADTRGRTNNGRVWVVAGQDDIADVNLLAPSPGQLLATIDGAATEDRIGSVAAAGDIDGDGVDDLVVGSYTATPWGSSVAASGAAYVVWGGGPDAVDLATLGQDGFRITGPRRQRDRLGISVAAAGDLNGDGLDDLLIGADGVSNTTTGPRNGGAAVVFGSASTQTVYTTPTDSTAVFTCANDPATGTCATAADKTARGYWIDGAANNDSAGYSVAGIGDVDRDGIDDLLVGAYGFDPVDPATQTARSSAGAVYVVRGKAGTTGQSLASLSPSEGYRLDGVAAGDRFGRQVAALGDVDGNGYDDIAAGADFANRGGAQAGEVTIALMGDLTTRTTLTADHATATPGQEVTLTARVTKPAGAAVTPSGEVRFSASGEAIPGCAAVTLTDGTATCTYAVTTVGAPSLQADYNGSAGLAASTSPAVRLDTRAHPSTTALAVTAAPHGTSWVLRAQVSGPGQTPTGVVALSIGGKQLAPLTLTPGTPGQPSTAAVMVPGTLLSPGSYTASVTYPGDATHAGSAATAPVVVTRGASTVRLRKAPPTAAGSRAKVRVSINAGEAVATGRIVVRSTQGRVLARTALTPADAGHTVVRLPRLPRGAYQIRAVYRGSALLLGDRSRTATLVVR